MDVPVTPGGDPATGDRHAGRPVRCGLIGLGMIGIQHGRILTSSARADFVMCCDLDPTAADRLPGIPLTTNVDELLDQPGLEAVFVCTPETHHREPVLRALERGLAVLCEKPLASTVEDSDAMLAAAQASSGSLVVGHSMRFDARLVELADDVQSGRLGAPVHLASRRVAGAEEGRMVDGRTTLPFYLGVHDLDMMRWLAGPISTVSSVAGGAGTIRPEVPDSVLTVVEFASTAVGSIELSWALPSGTGVDWDASLMFVGTAGLAYVEMRDTGLSIFAEQPRFVDLSSWPRTYGLTHGSLALQDDYFLRSLRGGSAWPQSLVEAHDAVVAAAAMDRSIAMRRPVRLSEVTIGASGAPSPYAAKES